MNNSIVVGSLFLILGWCSVGLCDPAKMPNIVLVIGDDHGWPDAGFMGSQQAETPNLDRLCGESMRFTQAYAGACECAPTRCSLMTGLHMGHARIRLNRSVRGQDHLLDEDVTVAEVLKRADYATGFFGKWGIGTPGTEGVPYKCARTHCCCFRSNQTIAASGCCWVRQ